MAQSHLIFILGSQSKQTKLDKGFSAMCANKEMDKHVKPEALGSVFGKAAAPNPSRERGCNSFKVECSGSSEGNYQGKRVQLALVKTPPMLEGWPWKKKKVQ